MLGRVPKDRVMGLKAMESENKFSYTSYTRNSLQKLCKGTGRDGNQMTNLIVCGAIKTVPNDWVRGLKEMEPEDQSTYKWYA